MNAASSRILLILSAVIACGVPARGQSPMASSSATHFLMPVPASVEKGTGRLALTRGFTVDVRGAGADRRLRAAVDRFVSRLEARTGIEASRAPGSATPTVVFDVAAAGTAIPTLADDESYTLTVTADGAIVRAPQVVGALRGMETLLQWVDGDRSGWYFAGVTITDKPRFPWRGLLIDVARHWMPMEVVKRQLDGMAAVKLNVLHLHLTEDQGFRIESLRYPKLHQAGSDGQYFTQAQIRDLIAYAADRGIRVVPEFDMPGHVTSWLVGHPELGAMPGPYEIQRRWGVFDPAFDPTREGIYTFLDRFLGEMAALFPDAYLHIGGDENNGKHWAASENIGTFMKAKGIADAHALQAYFNKRVLAILQKHGKRMVGWDEILHPDLPKDIVVQSWRGPKSLVDAATQGYQGILSSGYYIDLMQPTAQHYLNDPLPADSTLGAAESVRVLGGEATMWAEHVNPQTIDSRVWPRMAAIAERFWSRRDVRDVDDMFRRLARISVQLEEHGLGHESHRARMARRIARGRDSEAIETLLTVVQPVQGYKRGAQFKEAYGEPPSQMTPLTRLVDAAIADPPEARVFAAQVSRLIADAPVYERSRAEVRKTFTAWREAAGVLARSVETTPILAEGTRLTESLGALATVGLEALDGLEHGRSIDAAARDRMLGVIKAATPPVAQVEFAILAPLTALVEQAAR